jgi:hypothetical protein
VQALLELELVLELACRLKPVFCRTLRMGQSWYLPEAGLGSPHTAWRRCRRSILAFQARPVRNRLRGALLRVTLGESFLRRSS